MPRPAKPAPPPPPAPEPCPYRLAAEALRREAAAGSIRAILALADGALARLEAQAADSPEEMPAHVAAAMIAAALIALRIGPDRTDALIREHLA